MNKFVFIANLKKVDYNSKVTECLPIKCLEMFLKTP